MSKANVTAGQARSLIASFVIDTKWDEIDGNIQPFIELPPSERGEIFVDFLQEICKRFMFISITNFFNPAEFFFGESWSIWKGPIDGDGLSGEEDIDSRSLALSQIEINKFLFETCLKEGENSITGEQKLLHLKEKPNFIRFGGNVFFEFWLDYQAKKENSFLEQVYKKYKITYLDFFGTILRGPGGDRNVLCLYRNDDGQWSCLYDWLANDWNADCLSAGCASSA